MPENNCWNCGWNRLGGNTLMGVCWWFVKKLGYAKEIPRDVCDKGCKFWTDADIDFDTIKKFLKSEKQIMEDKQNGNRTNP
jgi:hypothetical protein